MVWLLIVLLQMLWCVEVAVVAAASVSVAAGQQFSYDGAVFGAADTDISSVAASQQAVLQAVLPVVAPAVPLSFSLRGLPTAAPILPQPQPVVPLPRGPLSCGFGEGSLVSVK